MGGKGEGKEERREGRKGKGGGRERR